MSSPAHHRLLVVDDEPDLRTLYELTLLREGYDVETAGTVGEAWQLLSERPFSAVITDMRLPDGTGLDLLQRMDTEGRKEKSIVITAYGSAENAVAALKSGAYDYLTKPVDLKQFRSVVSAAVAAEKSGKNAIDTHRPSAPPAFHRTVSPPPNAMSRLAGQSSAIQRVRDLIEKVSRSMAPVMLCGESGTGKELVAKAIHDVSTRAGGPFIPVNCGAIPEQLLEAEFFGYRKGAFTGAQEDREGFFQAANGGTLFLDELGDLPLVMQSKLLRAIQERAVRPVGATHEIAVDIRLLSATHKDLQNEVQQGHFRQDLYYRLNVIQITLPALRERMEDLPELCQRILERIALEAGLKDLPKLSESAMSALEQHTFTGNVRELENLLQRAVALGNHLMLEAADLGLSVTSDLMSRPTSPEPAKELPSAEPALVPLTSSLSSPLPEDLPTHLDEVERDILIRALEANRYNRTVTAASLGLSLRQIRYRMARLGVRITEQGLVVGEGFEPDVD